MALRCRIVLAVAGGKDGDGDRDRQWREPQDGSSMVRPLPQRRCPGTMGEIAPGRGRKAIHDATRIKAIIDATLQTKPKGSTHWSCRTMAAAQGIGKSSVNRICRSHNIKPHRSEAFKLSRDPKFLEKLTDVIGLLSESSRPCNCALCGPEEPNSGSA